MKDILVFGEVDEASKKQLINCIDDTSIGVLKADGHKANLRIRTNWSSNGRK